MKRDNKKMTESTEVHPMADKLLVRLMPELKRIIGEDADSRGIPGGMGELVAQILAEHYGRPDLSSIPRKKMGRPRKNVAV